MKNSNVVIYLRVSTDEQANQGYSLEYQESTTIRHCKNKNYNVLKIFKEDYSAKTFDRPVWNELVTFIKNSKGLVEKLVILKWDRFSRNLHESLAELKQLEKMKVKIDCVEQPIDYNDIDSKLMHVLHLLIPELENEKISQRTRDGMRQASLNGCWVGKPPLGYDRAWVQVDANRRNATLKPNSNAEVVVKIFDYFTKSGLSSDSIRKSINAEYGMRISKQGVLGILTNLCYLGRVKVKAHKDEPAVVVNGYHEGIVAEDIFYEAQDILKGKRRRHIRKDNREYFPLKEVIKCSVCGLSFTASITTKNKGLSKYPYYHCCKTKGHDRYPAETIHSIFEQVLKGLKVKDEILKLYEKVIIDTINIHNQGILIEKAKIENDITKVRARIQNVEDMLADGVADKQLCSSMLGRYKDEENALIMKHATLKSEAMPKPSDVEYLIGLFNSFDVLYKKSNYGVKKKIVSSIFPKPMVFLKDHFRTEEVSPLLELLVLNSNNLQGLKIEKSHFKSGSLSSAPLSGQFSNLIAKELFKINELRNIFTIEYLRGLFAKAC